MINGFSAHAGHGELLDFIDQIPKRPRQIFVAQGEPDAVQALARGLRDMGMSKVIIPKRGERFRI